MTCYDLLEKEAAEAHLPLKWPLRLPNSRYALAVAEQVRRHFPDLFSELKDSLYAAHFALGEDLGWRAFVNNCLKEFGVDSEECYLAYRIAGFGPGAQHRYIVILNGVACNLKIRPFFFN